MKYFLLFSFVSFSCLADNKKNPSLKDLSVKPKLTQSQDPIMKEPTPPKPKKKKGVKFHLRPEGAGTEYDAEDGTMLKTYQPVKRNPEPETHISF